MRVLPKLARNLEWIDAGRLPPDPLITGPMSFAVMDTAERYREFITCLTTKRARLYEPQVMRISRLAATQEAWSEGDIAKMFLVAVTTWRAYCEHALVDPLGLKLVGGVARVDALSALNRSCQRLDDLRLDGFAGQRRQVG